MKNSRLFFSETVLVFPGYSSNEKSKERVKKKKKTKNDFVNTPTRRKPPHDDVTDWIEIKRREVIYIA